MNEELKKDVEAMVAEIFSQKEEAEQRAETEKALQTSADTITKLTEALEGKNAESAEMEAKIEELNSELEAAKKEATETAEKLAESEKTIEEMKKDKAAELRMAELAEAGVALSGKDAQLAKIREMEDEEFAGYKDELVSLRSAVEAELAKAAPEETASKEETQEEEVAEETAEAEENEEEAANEEEEDVLPANVDPDKAVAAAMNLEAKPSDNLLAKYAKLGEALAARMKKDK